MRSDVATSLQSRLLRAVAGCRLAALPPLAALPAAAQSSGNGGPGNGGPGNGAGANSGPGDQEHHGWGGESDVNVCPPDGAAGTAHCDARARTDAAASAAGANATANSAGPAVT